MVLFIDVGAAFLAMPPGNKRLFASFPMLT